MQPGGEELAPQGRSQAGPGPAMNSSRPARARRRTGPWTTGDQPSSRPDVPSAWRAQPWKLNESSCSAISPFSNRKRARMVVDGLATPVTILQASRAGCAAVVFVNEDRVIHNMIGTTIWGTPSLDQLDRLPTLPAVSISSDRGASAEAAPRERQATLRAPPLGSDDRVVPVEAPGGQDRRHPRCRNCSVSSAATTAPGMSASPTTPPVMRA